MKTLIHIFQLFIFVAFFSQHSFSYDKIKIGLVIPLSGQYGSIGKSILNSTNLALTSIDNDKIEILPKDSESDPNITLKVSKELYLNDGVKIIIGPLFHSSSKYLNQLPDVTFLSLTNKIINNHVNVLSTGVNSISQINTIKKFLEKERLKNTIFLTPDGEFRGEIETAIKVSKIKLKDKFIYNSDPTLLTQEISKLTRYSIIKQNWKNEIERVKNTNIKNKKQKIEDLKKKDTLGGINFDSIIVADFDENLKSVLTSFLYTDVSSKRISYIAFNQWFDETLLKEEGLHPIYFPSINKKNFDNFFEEYQNKFNSEPNHISFLSYDLVGLVYYLTLKNNYKIEQKIFFDTNIFKGKIGIFEIKRNKITHNLSFYMVYDKKFTKIF